MTRGPQCADHAAGSAGLARPPIAGHAEPINVIHCKGPDVD